MSAPHDPRHAASPTSGAPSTQEIPIVPADAPEPPAAPGGGPPASPTGASRAAAPPAPGQHVPQHAGPPPVPPPPASAHPLPPAWPDTLTDDAVPPTRPATTSDTGTVAGTDGRPAGQGTTGPGDAAGPAGGVQPTGPVGFVPGLPGAGTTHSEPRKRLRAPSTALDRTALGAAGLAALAVVLLQLGLARDEADLWSAVPLWAAFATAATVLGLVVLAARAAAPARVPVRTATQLGGAAVLALAIFWLLVVLPVVASDPGFLVTAALLVLGAALWVGPGRQR